MKARLASSSWQKARGRLISKEIRWGFSCFNCVVSPARDDYITPSGNRTLALTVRAGHLETSAAWKLI